MTSSTHIVGVSGTIALDTLLDTISEFGAASRELVAWEFSLPETAVADAWDEARRRGLITDVGPCPETGETMYALSVGPGAD